MALQNFTIEYGLTVGNANITGSSGNINTSGYVNANFITVGNTISVTGNANVGNLVVNGKSNLGAVGNVTITGGSNGQYIQTDGNGNISWSTISTTSISNGNSNVVVAANGNVSISSAGTANVLVVTSTGANVAGTLNVTGNANLGNIGVTNAVVSANATFGNINSVSGILSVSGNANVGNLSTGIAVITANTVSTDTHSGALTVAGGVGITGNLNAGTAAASHIITGNVTITGNITVSGGQTIIGSNNTSYTDNIIELHNFNTNSDPWVTDDGRDIGIRVHYYKGGDNHAFFGWANDSQSMEYYYQATETSGVISGSYGTFKGNIFNSTATTGTAPFVVNSTTQVANLNAEFSGTVTSNSQPNITSVGTLGNISVTGNANVGNIGATNAVISANATFGNINSISGILSVSGNANVGNIGATNAVISANATFGNINSVSGILSVSGNANVGNIGAVNAVFTNVSGNGSALTSLTAGNLSGTITDSVLGNSTLYVGTTSIALNRSSSVQGLTGISSFSNGTSNVSIASNSNVSISSAGNANIVVVTGTGANITGTLNVTGNANVGNIGTVSGVFSGNVGIGPSVDAAGTDGVLKVRQILDGAPALTLQTNATGGSVALQVYDYKLGAWRGAIGHGDSTITSTTVSDFCLTSDTGNLVFGTNYLEKMRIVNSSGNVGIGNTNPLNTLSVSGTIYASGNANVGNIGAAAAVFTNTANVGNTLTVNTSNIATAIANGGTAGTGNIGAAGQGFDTLYARQASANYADLAEIYSSDDVYEYGTVVVFGGDQEITISTVSHDSRVAGVISQQPAFLMNDTASGLPVALTGRVPCRVLGPVTKGALLTSSNIAGVAMVLTADQYVPGCVIGKSLENNHNGGTLIIEAVIGRM